jgi:hypothetical protein
MSVIEAVPMVEICLMNERVSPSWSRQQKDKNNAISGTGSENPNRQGSTHMEYIRAPRVRKVPALITANFTVFAFTKTLIH